MIYNVNKDWKGDMMFNNKIKELQQELFNKQDEIDRLKISLSQTKDTLTQLQKDYSDITSDSKLKSLNDEYNKKTSELE